MTALVFVDTNIFVYARDDADENKRRLAQEWLQVLWRDTRGRTSVQVLNEYYGTLTLKMKFRIPREIAWEDVSELMEWQPQEIDSEVLTRAHEIEGQFRLNWWDCLVVAAADIQGCSLLLTEDLQDGQNFNGLVAINPFKLGVSEAHKAYEARPKLSSRHRGRGRPRRHPRAASG
jgi:predicted nucleic acid-binding protein